MKSHQILAAYKGNLVEQQLIELPFSLPIGKIMMAQAFVVNQFDSLCGDGVGMLYMVHGDWDKAEFVGWCYHAFIAKQIGPIIFDKNTRNPRLENYDESRAEEDGFRIPRMCIERRTQNKQ